jgi:hypothetical protein
MVEYTSMTRKDYRVEVTVSFAVDIGSTGAAAAAKTARFITKTVFDEWFSRAQHVQIKTLRGKLLPAKAAGK